MKFMDAVNSGQDLKLVVQTSLDNMLARSGEVANVLGIDLEDTEIGYVTVMLLTSGKIEKIEFSADEDIDVWVLANLSI